MSLALLTLTLTFTLTLTLTMATQAANGSVAAEEAEGVGEGVLRTSSHPSSRRCSVSRI